MPVVDGNCMMKRDEVQVCRERKKMVEKEKERRKRERREKKWSPRLNISGATRRLGATNRPALTDGLLSFLARLLTSIESIMLPCGWRVGNNRRRPVRVY